MNGLQKYYFNITFLVISILWPLFKSLYLNNIDGAGRVEMLLIVAAVIVNGNKRFKIPKPMYIWLIWIIYVTVNTGIRGFHHDTISYANWVPLRLIFPMITMFVAYSTMLYNSKKTIKILFYVLFLYFILGALGMSFEEAYDVGTRSYNDLGNDYFHIALFVALFAALLYQYGNMGKIYFYFTIALVAGVIIISGERKSLLALFIIIFGSLFGYNIKKGKRAIFGLVLLGLATYLSVNFIFNHTTAGTRLQNSMESSAFDDNLFLQLMGDRGLQYFEGWKIFLDNLWTGIGLNNFKWINSFNYGLPLHSEFMVQLTECGIVGSSLFLLFYLGIINRLIYMVKHNSYKVIPIILSSAFLAIVLIDFVAWTFDSSIYFIIYAIIFAYYDKSKCEV